MPAQGFRNAVCYIFPHGHADGPTEPNLPPVEETGKQGAVPRYRWRFFLTNAFWLALSAGCIVAIGVVLHRLSPRRDPSFPLNAIIAWLSSAAKLFLAIPLIDCIGQAKWTAFQRSRRKFSDLDLLDSASRTPLGALSWIIRFRTGIFLHLGAALVILGFAFEPATQHLLSQHLGARIDGNVTSQIAVNHAYSPTRGIDRGLIFAIPKALLAGAYSAVLGNPLQADYTCPSGNCTVSTTTVAICSVCTDITRSLERECRNLSQDDPFCLSRDTCYTTGRLCTWRDPITNATAGGNSSVFLDAVAEGASFSDSSNGRIAISPALLNFTAVFVTPGGEPDFPDTGTLFETRFPVAPGHISARNGEDRARAYNCAISYCAQHVDAQISLGVVKEQTKVVEDSLDELTLEALNLDDINDELLSRNIPLTESGEEKVSVAALFALSQGLAFSLTGNSSQPSSASPQPGSISEFHRALYESLISTSFPELVSRMAKSMTASVRNDASQADWAKGDVWVAALIRDVRWGWMGLLGGIWAGVALLLITLTVMAKVRATPWLGDSSVATAMIGLERDVKVDVDLSGAAWDDRIVMRKEAEKHRVRVAPVHSSEGGPKLEFTRLQ